MSDQTIDDEDRRRVADALQGMYERLQEPPELPADQRTVLPGQRQEFDLELVIFDIDGTLTQTQSGDTFPRSLTDRAPIRHAEAKVAKLHDLGVNVAVATNQGGVAHGYYDLTELRSTLCEQLYWWYGISNWNVMICPHHPKGTVKDFARECACRKPSPYMLLHLMIYHHVAPSRTLFVGDMETDREAAVRAGCHFMWAHEYFMKREWR